MGRRFCAQGRAPWIWQVLHERERTGETVHITALVRREPRQPPPWPPGWSAPVSFLVPHPPSNFALRPSDMIFSGREKAAGARGNKANFLSLE